MEDDKNIEAKILKLEKKVNELEADNKDLKQKVKYQEMEIQNLKEENNKYRNEILLELQKTKERINSISINKIGDNAPPICATVPKPMSATQNNTTSSGIEETEKGEYVTSVSFYRSSSIDLSMTQLIYYGYEPVEGDIRKDAGGLCCVLGCKFEKNQSPITNIIGNVSEKEEPVIIYENKIKYTAIKDPLNNADIHKGSNGNFLCFYYTRDPNAGRPIKGLRTLTTNKFLNDPNMVKYCTRSTMYNKPFESLDCNRGRNTLLIRTRQNYIIIDRD